MIAGKIVIMYINTACCQPGAALGIPKHNYYNAGCLFVVRKTLREIIS